MTEKKSYKSRMAFIVVTAIAITNVCGSRYITFVANAGTSFCEEATTIEETIPEETVCEESTSEETTSEETATQGTTSEETTTQETTSETTTQQETTPKPTTIEPTTPERTTAKNSFEVKFNYNGGVNVKHISKITVTNGKKYGNLPETKRKGYKFVGWYTSNIGVAKITKDTIVRLKDAQTLYARWEKINVSENITISKFNQKKGKITIKISNAKKAVGYIIYCSDNKKFKKTKKINVFPSKKKYTFKVSDVIKKAKSGRVYYYRIRPYMIDSAGKKVWGIYGRTNKCLYRKQQRREILQ